MTANSSSRKSYNHLALQGHGIDDDKFITDWNENKVTPGSLDPGLAFTKELMPTVINLGIQDDLDRGVIDDNEAVKRRARHMKRYRELLAENGMLK